MQLLLLTCVISVVHVKFCVILIKVLKRAILEDHSGGNDTSVMYFIRHDLVDLKSIKDQSCLDQGRLNRMQYGYNGIWCYARYPNHYFSDIAEPDRKPGEPACPAGKVPEGIQCNRATSG